MISLTPKAAQRIKAQVQKQGLSEGFLRLRVSSGGCSGMNYAFEFTDKPLPGDLVSELDGAKIAVDPKSDFFLNGSIVDWVQSLMESRFAVKNPNAATSCNCGTSFST